MMKLTKSKNVDELCYPFIYEHSYLCDYEIHTDAMCRQIGGLIAAMPGDCDDLRAELEHLQPLIYHLNGSIRGKCAVSESDLEWLLECYRAHKKATEGCLDGFVLPRGEAPVPQLNAASSDAKKAIRLMVRIHQKEAREIPDVLHRFCNLLCNYFFTLTILINKRRGLEEIPFASKSYRMPKRSQ
jgi:cob(I)alamin adenosyltransferase